MKKIFASILFVLYFAASSGATINFHYCMGKLIGWDVSTPGKCSNCGMQKEKQKGCCNDKHATFTIKKEQLAAQINTIPYNSFHYLDIDYFSSEKVFSSVSTNKLYTSLSPPGLKVSLLILNCVFRI